MTRSTVRSGVIGAVPASIAAYVLGYVLTYLASSTVAEESGLNQLLQAFGDGDATVQIVGWVFYNAHFVTTTFDVDVPFVGGQSTLNLIAESGELSPVLYVIPPAMLFAAGLAAVRWVGATETDDALRIGPAVAIGYLPMVVLGVFLFTLTVGGSSGQPTLLPAVALAGVVYPIVFGTLGAIVATALRQRR